MLEGECSHMALIDDLLGCSLSEITRSYWAAKLKSGEWVSEARMVHDWRVGASRYLDWYLDIVATGDHKRVIEMWLLCPPSRTSAQGNTARLPITSPSSAFQFKTSTSDSVIIGRGIQTLQSQVIGRVENEAGDCTCFIFDPIQGGLLTPKTEIQDTRRGGIHRDSTGNPRYAGKTNVLRFHAWRDSVAPVGLLALDRLGVVLG